MSKERCLKIADSAGVSNSIANSLLSLRDETALKDFKRSTKINSFFYPLLAFCIGIMDDEMHKFENLQSIA